MKSHSITNLILLTVVAGWLLAGCGGYKINYSLNQREIVRSQQPCSLAVAVAILNDIRDERENLEDAQEAISADNVGDYTYDKDFKGEVDVSISEMLASHLEYSRSFRKIALLKSNSATLSRPVMDSLGAMGVEAVLTGNIVHFSGFYDQRPMNEALFQVGLGVGIGVAATLLTMEKKTYEISNGFSHSGMSYPEVNPIASTLGATAGAELGSLIESSSKRDIARHTQLSVSLLSTATSDTLWKEIAEVAEREYKSLPGFNTSSRKQELAVSSLREAVNKIVESLSKAQIHLPDKNQPSANPVAQTRSGQ